MTWRIRSFASIAERVPAECHVEIGSDSEVWLFTDEGHRVMLSLWLDAGMPPVDQWDDAFGCWCPDAGIEANIPSKGCPRHGALPDAINYGALASL